MTDKPTKPSSRDYGFMAICWFVAANAVWLLLMPVVPAIASATLNRFHLNTSSFAVWAIQQPIPSMYNFANRYEIHKVPPGMVDPILVADNQQRYINHFPTRVITFADTRVDFRDGKDRWFTFESSYRGRTLQTQVHVQAKAGGGFTYVRLASQETAE
jgi:hypothetical protein